MTDFFAALAGKTVLVAGASGYLGAALLKALRAVPCRVVALTRRRLPASLAESPRLTTFIADLSDPAAWNEALAGAEIDVVFHLAAHEHRHGSPHAPALDLAVNAASVLHLVERCRQLPRPPRIVFASSANLVGCPTRQPVDETFPDQPLTLFAIHKITAERYLQHYARQFGVPSVVLRFANVYGPLGPGLCSLAERVVLNRILLKALTGGPLFLYPNQNCRRDFVYVDDAVNALGAAACSEVHDGSPHLVASGESRTLREIVELAAELAAARLARPVAIQLQDQVELEPIEWREFVADVSRLRQATGWKPQFGLRAGLERTLEAFSAEASS